MDTRKISLSEYWNETERKTGKKIRIGTESFKKMRIRYLIEQGDEEMASIIAVISDKLWNYFLKVLAECKPESKFLAA